MATTFKTFLNNDIASTRTMLHESIPITGSLVSGTYGGATVALGSEPHIKNYSHGMFQSVYDYPYLSSSANHIFDIAIGISPQGTAGKGLYSSVTSQQAKKANMYGQMAQILMGHDVTGSIQEFDADGNLVAGGAKLREVFFLNFARLLAKDEVKKGSFQLELGISGSAFAVAASDTTMDKRIKLTDASGSNGFFVNSPAGEYGILYAQTTADGDGALSEAQISNETLANTATHPACGLIFYQAGIAVVSGSVFNNTDQGGLLLSRASVVITITSATILNGDTIAILALNADGGTATTTVTATATTSGATTTTDTNSPTFHVQYGGSASDRNITATNLATCLNANSKLTATAASAVVTVTQVASGVGGNTAITYVDNEANGVGATNGNFTGGDNGAVMLPGTSGFTGFNFVSASTIEATTNAIRNRIYNLSFNNSTELNSSIYFCRINHNDFNYSSNPTYLSGSKLRVKNSSVDNPVTYLTTVGLYSADNELLAVAKVSEPIKKDPTTELTLRVRLDY